MLSGHLVKPTIRGSFVALCLMMLGVSGCGGPQRAPGDLEAAILSALRSTPYSQSGGDPVWSWACLWAGASSTDCHEVTWRIESRDSDRVVWMVTLLTPQLSAAGKDSLYEGPRFLVDIEDWVAELDLSTPGSQVMWNGMQSLGLMVGKWNLVGTPPSTR